MGKTNGWIIDDVTYAIAVYPSGNIYMAGYFRQTSDFDPASPVYNLTALGNGDGFIHKMSPCTGSTSSTLLLQPAGPILSIVILIL